MNADQPVPYLDRPVVVGHQGHESDHALRWAVDEAQRRKVPLRLVRAYDDLAALPPWGYPAVPGDVEQLRQDLRADVTQDLAVTVDQVRADHPLLDVAGEVVGGSASAALVLASAGAGIVVTGRRARHRWAAPLGSVCVAVASHSDAPTVVVPARSAPEDEVGPDLLDSPVPPGHVVLGLDDSPECADAAGFAFDEAAARGVPLTVVHSWWFDSEFLITAVADEWSVAQPGERVSLDATLEPWQERYPQVELHRVTARRDPAVALLDAARDAELLVVGSRGRGGFASLMLGSVSRRLLTHSSVPLAVVRRGQVVRPDA